MCLEEFNRVLHRLLEIGRVDVVAAAVVLVVLVFLAGGVEHGGKVVRVAYVDDVVVAGGVAVGGRSTGRSDRST